MKYRPEVDGLRAVAVISVLLFQAGFAVFSGGFVGVVSRYGGDARRWLVHAVFG